MGCQIYRFRICAGNFSYCPYYDADGTVELEVETIDVAFEIAKAEIDDDVSKDNIYQMGRWWIVNYEDEDGVYTQARIDAVTGEIYTGYNVPAGAQAGRQAVDMAVVQDTLVAPDTVWGMAVKLQL
ncbi:hypothetical protein [Methanosarcina horonobensis]|uniref:hypothetical protein n=1 Tax=Methanosarcina horonobensis TaxID=418008 RepID=UPI000A594BC5|nr:hypothetical protein [Methanosarcina horonobensis]